MVGYGRYYIVIWCFVANLISLEDLDINWLSGTNNDILFYYIL